MSRTEEPGALSRNIPPKIQWLAASAGCVTAVALLGISWIFSLLAIPLVLTAALASFYPRVGRLLILIPALVLSVMILPICMANAVELVKSFVVGPHDFTILAVRVSWLLSPLLLVCCITTVWTHSVKHRRGLT